MDLEKKHKQSQHSQIICEVCGKQFSTTSAKNRHLRNFHEKTMEEKRTQHILCPLCPKKEKFSCHKNLTTHLKQFHGVGIKESILNFRNFEDFKTWKGLENRDVDYACHRKCKRFNGEQNIYYNCNRSDSKSTLLSQICRKRKIKSGGSIRIRGICPSRIVVKISKNGLVTVKFVETHVGHADELRTKRLSKSKQKIILGQLAAGVTNESIIQDSRNSPQCSEENDVLYVDEHTISQIQYQDNVTTRFIEESGERQNSNTSINFEKRRKIALEEIWKEICDHSRGLDEESFDKFMTDLKLICSNHRKAIRLSK